MTRFAASGATGAPFTDPPFTDTPFSDPPFTDTPFSDPPFSDIELTEMALAADVDAPLDPDAVPFQDESADFGLPGWYMPPAQAAPRSRRQRLVRITIAASLLGVNAMGLCVTYGQLVIA
ncbi:MAG: hypothetical protein JWL70_2444 [Acidimicrobiia bacterium]|nr:hypothetical protein [Acidimicrobiia bacterium]